MGQYSGQSSGGGFGQQSPYNFGQQPNMWGGGQNMGGSMQGGMQGYPPMGGPQGGIGGMGQAPWGAGAMGGMQKPMPQQQQTGPAPFTGDPGSYAAMQAMLAGRNANAGDVFSGQAPASTGAGHGFINPAYTQMNPLARPNNGFPGFYPGVQR